MNYPVLSIIVPSYNIANFVNECVSHFLNEELLDMCHIYFIDDGATDNTKEELLKYVKLYPNSLSFVHKENGGHGSVINYGIEHLVNTKYFRVVDGDDYIDTNSLIELCNFIKNNDYDLIIDDYTRVYSNHTQKIESLVDKKHPELLSSYILNLHNMTFRTSIFIENYIKVRERVFYEDNEYVLFPLPYIKTFKYIQLNIYRYRLDNQNQSVSFESRLKKRNDSLLINKDLIERYLFLSQNETLMTDVVVCYMKRLSSFLTNEYILDLLTLKSSREIKSRFKEYEAKNSKMPKLRLYMKKTNKKYRLMCFFRFKHIFLLRHIFLLLKGDKGLI